MTPHVHPCPECYNDWPCAMDCSIVTDLRRDNGMASGSHALCGPCDRAMKPCAGCSECTTGFADQTERCRDCWLEFALSKVQP